MESESNDVLRVLEQQRNLALNENVRLAALLIAAQRKIAELEKPAE